MARVRKTSADWLEAVMLNREIQGETRALLMYLATFMRPDRMTSKTYAHLAKVFGVSVRRIRGRLDQAHEVGLLVTVVHGRPGVASVYQGTFPDVPCAGGAAHQTAKHVPEPRHKESAQHVPDVRHPTGKRSEPEPINEPERSNRQDVPRSAQAPTQLEKNEDSSFIVGAERLRSARETRSGNEVDRATARELIQQVAANGGYMGDDDGLWGALEELHEGLGDWASCYWSFPRLAATDRKEAGKQLNMLINTWRQEAA